jgi:hypothetical protein
VLAATKPELTTEIKEVSFWTRSAKVKPQSFSESTPVELGTRFTANHDGWVAGVRFLKAAGEKGRHAGSLWDADGHRLAKVTFGKESPSGWQEARFAKPVRIGEGEVYTVSFHSQGTYVGQPGAGTLRNGPLAVAKRTGVYAYGRGAFPHNWNPKNYTYYVDPIYRWWHTRPTGPTETAKPPVTTAEPSASDGPTVTVAPTNEVPQSPIVTAPGTTATPETSLTPTATGPTATTSGSPRPSHTPSGSPSTGHSEPPSPSASPSASAKPTPTPTATPTATRSPSPGPSSPPSNPGGGGCAAFPTPDCTGVPSGMALTKSTLKTDGGAYRITTPGTVLDGVRVPGDLLITADDVTIRNSQIDGTVIGEYENRFYSFTITDTTVGPAKGCLTAPGIGDAHYTAKRVLIRGHGDGFRASGDGIDIQDSYVHLCSNPGDHSDGIQTYKTGRGLILNHNTIDQRDAKDITAPIFITDKGTVDVTVTNNLVMGGTYSIQVKNAHGTQVVRGNKLVDESWVYGPVEAECGTIDWSGNSLVTIDGDYRVTSTVGALPCAS